MKGKEVRPDVREVVLECQGAGLLPQEEAGHVSQEADLDFQGVGLARRSEGGTNTRQTQSRSLGLRSTD